MDFVMCNSPHHANMVLILVDTRIQQSPSNWIVPRRPIKWAEVTHRMAGCPDNSMIIVGAVPAIRGLEAGTTK
ncbi:MAG: hypothetical protein WD063_16870 [Pirellulales bacterium]